MPLPFRGHLDFNRFAKHKGDTAISAGFLPYGRQSLDADDIAAVADSLRSDWLTTGPQVEAFEKALADCCGAKHAIAVANGTAALHIAMLAAGVGPNDKVITSANTFLASANSAVFVGAKVDFADIDPRTYNLSADSLRSIWTDDVRAVVSVDFAGQPADLPRISALAKEKGAVLIDDAAHAIGSDFEHDGQSFKVGGNPFADMTTFSFHPVKTVTTGEGGAIMTDNDEYARKCRLFRGHGMIRDKNAFAGLGDAGLDEFGPWYYEMHDVGFNYRITDFQCALGMRQLGKLQKFKTRRQEIVDQYNTAFKTFPNTVTPHRETSNHPAWHLYVLQIDFKSLGKSRTQVMSELKELGIGSQVHYIPVHLQPFYSNKFGYAPSKCPVAEAYYRRCLSLPLYPAMSDADVSRVILAVRTVLQHHA